MMAAIRVDAPGHPRFRSLALYEPRAPILAQGKALALRCARAWVRTHVPHNLRVERVRMLRAPSWIAERPLMARARLSRFARGAFAYSLAQHESPLRRVGTVSSQRMQRGKETNVRRVAERLDGLVIEPGQTFSYHHAVGRPSRRKGFVPGPEMHDGVLTAGMGGGACQAANLLLWMGLNAGLEVVERHRHGLDLFPDSGRTVPFGCGATVFYTQCDLRLRNPHRHALVLSLEVSGGKLIGELRLKGKPDFRCEIVERDHRFERVGTQYYRCNRIVRRSFDEGGSLLREAELMRNRSLTLYEPDMS